MVYVYIAAWYIFQMCMRICKHQLSFAFIYCIIIIVSTVQKPCILYNTKSIHKNAMICLSHSPHYSRISVLFPGGSAPYTGWGSGGSGCEGNEKE